MVAADFMMRNVFSAAQCRCRVCTVTVSESEVPFLVPETVARVGAFCEVVSAERAMA